MDSPNLLLQVPQNLNQQQQQPRSVSAASSSSLDSSATSNPTQTSVLRRDAARVLRGLFDTSSNASSSHSNPSLSHPSSPVITQQSDLSSSKSNKSRTPKLGALEILPSSDHQSSSMAFNSSSFSYTPLPDDYSSPEPEYDYAAAQAYINGEYDYSDSDSDQSAPPTPPPVDFLGMGTPIFSPALLEKVIAAMAEGKPLYMEHARRKDANDKERKRKHRKKPKDGIVGADGKPDGAKEAGDKVKDKKKKKQTTRPRKDTLSTTTTTALNPRAPSTALSTTSSSTQNKHTAASANSSGTKRRHSSAFGVDSSIADGGKRARAGTTSSETTTHATGSGQRPRQKCRKGWKGWVEVEVSTSEDEDEEEEAQKEKAADPLPKGITEESQGSATTSVAQASSASSSSAKRKKSVGTTDNEDSDGSDNEQGGQKKGWKGWALVESPPDTSKLIKLDHTPPILTTRATRSGRTFGEDEWDEKFLRKTASSSAVQGGRRRRSTGVSSRS